MQAALSPPSLLERCTAALRLPLSFPMEAQQDLAKVQWNCRLRWFAVISFTILAGVGLHFGYLNRETIPAFLGIVALIGIFNLFTQLLLGRAGLSAAPRTVFLQLTFDLVSLIGLVAIGGGSRSPFATVVLMNISLGAVLLTGGWALVYLFLAHILVALLQLQSLRSFLNPPEDFFASALIFHLFLLAFWIALRSLGIYLDRTQEWRSELLVASGKQDRLRAIGALAAGFSHEFSSPLNTAKIRLERAARENPTPDVQEALRAIDACSLVVREMNTSQLDPASFRLSRVNLAELLNDILDSWEEVNELPGLKREVAFVGQTILSPVNFSQVVLNLLDNSLQAGTAAPIAITLAKENGEFVFAVEDAGPGFPASVLLSVGQPFVTTKSAGTGLGLYVSGLFAESLGGQLKAENLSERGSRVTLRWPEAK
jgi:two-component system sensor histidine kinase RegB